MTHMPSLPSFARLFVVLALAATAAAVSAQSATPAVPQQVTLSLDRDLVTFVKAAVWAAGIFLAIFATLAVGFFGFDVRAARKSLLEANEDLRERMEAIRKDHQSLVELKERLGKLGAELIEQIEKKTPPTAPPNGPQPPEEKPKEPPPKGPLSQVGEMEEEQRASLRTLLAASEFEWSTVGTLARRMALSREDLIALADSDPLVQRGTGRNGDILYRLKKYNNLLAYGPGSMTREDWDRTLWEHASTGKQPRGSMGAKPPKDHPF